MNKIQRWIKHATTITAASMGSITCVFIKTNLSSINYQTGVIDFARTAIRIHISIA